MTTKQIEATILGQSYRLACSPETEAALLEAVARVDAEMTKIRSMSNVRGTDRIAVMAGLNIAHDLLRERRASTIASAAPPPAAVGESFDAEAARRRIQAMQATIDETLAGQENLF